MLRFALALALTFSFGSVACTADTTSARKSASASAGDADTAATSWLAGSEWSLMENLGYEIDREDVTFDADGTGEQSNVTVDLVTSYGVGDKTTRGTFTWSATPTILTVDATDYVLTVTPNCRQLVFGNRILHGSSPNPCPFDVPALTSEERSLVGTWHFVRGYDEDATKSEGTLTFEADRNVIYDFTTYKYTTEDTDKSREVRGYVTTRSNHKLRAVDPVGKDVGLSIVVGLGTLRVCMIECNTLTKK